MRVWLQFQFHKGTIKTQLLEHGRTFQSYFNSIKVQLKHVAEQVSKEILIFQFHKGTIKTCCKRD